MSTIQTIIGREILDSRGNPTIEIECLLGSGVRAKASVPSGASTGIHEALELRDGDLKRYSGLGVLKAVENINEKINPSIQNKDFDQKNLDQTLIQLDSTENKSVLGANAILGVSMAFARASAIEKNIELYQYLGDLAHNNNFRLPTPLINIINGGKHADSGLNLQEFIIAPTKFDNFHQKIRAGKEIISCLEKTLKNMGLAVSIGDEGGFAPKLSSGEEALDLIEKSISDAGYSSDQIKIGIDAASSTFYKDNYYSLKIEGQYKNLTSIEIVDWYGKLVSKYPIIFIEDGLAEDDFDGFSHMMSALGEKIMIVGDDLTVTNTKRIKKASEKKSINAVIIKPNQIGTITETIEAILMTKSFGWTPFISHRSGETTDTFIADLSIGCDCSYIKSGSLARGERVCKYNRLMEIEDGLQKII